MLEVINDIPDKLYKGAIVHYPSNSIHVQPVLMRKILLLLRHLHLMLHVSKQFSKPDDELLSYDIAHHVGFSMEEEYELIELMTEPYRLQYIINHLDKVIPIIAGTEKLKDRINLNGHFREIKGFNL